MSYDRSGEAVFMQDLCHPSEAKNIIGHALGTFYTCNQQSHLFDDWSHQNEKESKNTEGEEVM